MAFRKTAISLAALAAVAATPAATAFAQQAEPERATEKPTICSTVAWLADSTGVNLKKPGTGVITNDGTISDPTSPFEKSLQPIKEVKKVIYDVLPGRSFHETTPHGINGIDALKNINKDNKDIDCYLLQMGTNDAANIALGSTFTAEDRIKAVLENTGNSKVIWIAPQISKDATVQGYTPAAADVLNKALAQAEKDTPRLKIVSLPDKLKEAAGKVEGLPATPDEFFVDGIHYKGMEVTYWMSDLIADSLKVEQPKDKVGDEVKKTKPESEAPSAETATMEPGEN